MKLTPRLRQDLKNFLKARLADQKEVAHVYAAHQLTAAELQSIQSKHDVLRNAILEPHIDPRLLAGYVVEVGSKRLDCSLKSRLNTIFA